MKLYLDACCYNRPFDDQSQDRIRLEAEAVIGILEQVEEGRWQTVGSEVLGFEIMRCRDSERRERVRRLTELAQESITVDDTIAGRARELIDMGLNTLDALHVACAESSEADVFLTTDDQVLRWAGRRADALRIRVANPLAWLNEVWEQ